jgi:hypothetical protein
MRAEDFTGAAKLLARKHYHDAMPPDMITATFAAIGGKVSADTAVTQPVALMKPADGLSPNEATNDLERELLILVNKGRTDPGPAEMGAILQELAGEEGEDLLPPVNTIIPQLGGSIAVGDTMTCDTGTWSNAPSSYHYAWKHAGSVTIGADEPTLLLVAGDVGHMIACRVTALNDSGSGYADSTPVGPIVETR